MLNEKLAEQTRELPEGYRWEYARRQNSFTSKGYVDTLYLQRNVLGLFWKTVATGYISKYSSVSGVSYELYRDYFGEGHGIDLIGTTK